MWLFVSQMAIGLQKHLQDEVMRYNKFRKAVLGKDADIVEKQKQDIRNYAKYILTEGTGIEKRELLSNLQSKLILNKKELALEK